jgi:hypothetical protein
MKIPKTIKILGHLYRIEYVKDLSRDRNLRGEVLYGKLLINLSPDIPTQLQEEALLHEVIHAISNEVALDLSENQVTSLSSVLYQVLKDNCLL